MSEDSFYAYLKQGGRSDAAAARCQILVDEFAHWLGHDPLSAEAADIDAYIVHRGREAKGSLWALRYFFDYCNRSDLARLTGERRQELIEPATHSLASLEGVPSDLVARLTADGIRSIEDLRRAAADRDERRRLAERTGPGFADLYELARFMEIRGVKNVRGRLYRGCAGTLEYLAAMEPEELISCATKFIDSTGFAGVAPTPKEAAYTISEARRLTSYSS